MTAMNFKKKMFVDSSAPLWPKQHNNVIYCCFGLCLLAARAIVLKAYKRWNVLHSHIKGMDWWCLSGGGYKGMFPLSSVAVPLFYVQLVENMNVYPLELYNPWLLFCKGNTNAALQAVLKNPPINTKN